MKRIDMLYKLTELMRKNWEVFEEYSLGHTNFNQLETQVTNMFLDEIEKQGMLPPYNTQYQDHGSVTDCQWEPEIEMTEEEEFNKITNS